MRIAQLSDLHLTDDGSPLYGHVDTEGAARQAVQTIADLIPRPDFLLLTGDLADGGSDQAYRRLRQWLERAGIPYALVPGNHDQRATLRRVFPEQGWPADGLCCQRVDCGEGALVLVDSQIPGEEAGEIGPQQQTWLEALGLMDRPTLLVMHHPPFAVGIPGMDAIRCRGSDDLAVWMARQPAVEALLCGHVHRFVSSTFAGRPALIAPSPAHQIAYGPGPLAYTLEPGGFLLHDWRPGQGLITHYLPVWPAAVHVYRD